MSDLEIVVIGDEVQPSSATAAALRGAFSREAPDLDVSIGAIDWRPANGFAAAAESAERGLDVDALPEGWPEVLADADVLITHFFPVRDKVLAAAPRLRLVATLRHGEENVDREAARARSVDTINNPGREAAAVSDFAVTLILNGLRRLTTAVTLLRESSWADAFAEASRGRTLSGATIGLIGFGYVGRQVAAKLAGFGCRILVHDPFHGEADLEAEAVEVVSLGELLTQSDVVSLHLRLSDATRGLIGRDQLALMRHEAYLVNTARAELVDEEALVEALATSSIGGAGLDVFWEEPLASDHPLRTFTNVTLTPHMAGSAFNAQEHSAHLLAARLAGVVKNWSRNP
jgi:D-3-phosphoglycerate dehydrogenase